MLDIFCPKDEFHKVENMFKHKECTVCLCEFGKRDIVRKIRPCRHIFHRDCLETWLKKEEDCPMCKEPIAVEYLDYYPTLSSDDSDLEEELLDQVGQRGVGLSSTNYIGD